MLGLKWISACLLVRYVIKLLCRSQWVLVAAQATLKLQLACCSDRAVTIASVRDLSVDHTTNLNPPCGMIANKCQAQTNLLVNQVKAGHTAHQLLKQL